MPAVRPDVLTFALMVSGVAPPIGVRANQVQEPLVEMVIASPAAGFALAIEIAWAGGAGSAIR